LVPGDPAALHAHAAALTSRGDSLIQTGTSLKRVDATEAGSGQTAEAFQEKFAPHPNQWLTAGDAHQDAAAAVSGYAETLQWAQGQAGTAAHQWDEAQTATEAALNQYNTNAAAGVRQRRTPVRRSGPVFPPCRFTRSGLSMRICRAPRILFFVIAEKFETSCGQED
jgi:hypothetical protein